MSAGVYLLIAFIGVLFIALVWAGKPLRSRALDVEESLEILSGPMHSSHLAPILKALRTEDADFLKEQKRPELAKRLLEERRRIGLRYLRALQDEFESLLAASQMLAKMSPELIAMEEFERLKLSLRFALLCWYMRWRLTMGLPSWGGFGLLSTMVGRISMGLERASAGIAERAMRDS